jgi:holo-[acyl-carrier protein] synthase
VIVGIGVDIIEVERIKTAIETYGERFLKRVFTANEINYCETFKDTKWVHYAARFSAKEAFSKAVGTGLTQGFKLNEVGVINGENGKPEIELFGGLREKWGSYKINVSISHINAMATAVVIIED